MSPRRIGVYSLDVQLTAQGFRLTDHAADLLRMDIDEGSARSVVLIRDDEATSPDLPPSGPLVFAGVAEDGRRITWTQRAPDHFLDPWFLRLTSEYQRIYLKLTGVTP